MRQVTAKEFSANGEEECARGDGEAPLLPPPSQPMQVAREFVTQFCTRDGGKTLLHWRGGWWGWRNSHWREVDNKWVRSLLYRLTENATYLDPKKGEILDWAPNRKKIGDLLDALAAVVFFPEEHDQPCWLDQRASGVIVAVENGLLDVERRRLLPHTPWFFNQTSVPFKYDAGAPEPAEWITFLQKLWPREPEAIAVVGEWFGYVISGRLDLHKILMTVGPTRGGKGAIARVLTALIGRKNIVGPTLSSLGGEFGLQPLIGKPLAIISDARFSGKNPGIMVERLLTISGEDTLTVNRKCKEMWTGKLPTRLYIISNELPKLGDASAAVVGRVVLLTLSESWLGREDIELEARLHGELPGILNWSLAGLERLTLNANFTRVPSSEEAVDLMRDLASPVAAFVRQECEFVDGNEISVDDLYAAFKVWAEDNEQDKLSQALFGRNLKAAFPAIRKIRTREGGERRSVYRGIALAAAAVGATMPGHGDHRGQRS